jgi:DNA primase
VSVLVPEERIAAVRRHTQLSRLIGRDVALRQRGREHVGRCPFHSEKTPSFTVVDAKRFWHCFGCGAHGDAIQWLIQRHGLSFADAVASLDGGRLPTPEEAARDDAAERRRDEAEAERRMTMRELARSLWAESVAIAGTPGEAYFRGRGITIGLPPTLRYHARVALGPRFARVWLPAVVAAVKGWDGKIDAVHRIFLDPGSVAAGRPRKAAIETGKALLGTVKGGAVRFGAAAPVMTTCEGLETGTAILQALPETALWAGIDATHMAAIRWPDAVRMLDIFADRDRVSAKPGMFFGKRPGEYWAQRAAAAFIASAAGRRARIVMPPPIAGMGDKADFNDLLLAG